MVVPLPCPTLRSLVRGCIGAAAVLVCVVGCARPEPEPPPAVLPSVESVADRTVEPTDDDLPSVEVEQWPDDPEVRAAVEAYVAFENAMAALADSGGSKEAAQEAKNLGHPEGNVHYFVEEMVKYHRDLGPLHASGTTTLRNIRVTEREADGLELSLCMDNSEFEIPDHDYPEYLHATPWMTRSEDGQWLVHSLFSDTVDQC